MLYSSLASLLRLKIVIKQPLLPSLINICDQNNNMLFTSPMIPKYLASYNLQAETDFFKATSYN
jgi:hypothetical protein